ncbi:MAG: 16S rRNA (uracil(1498)-N(3))-methyltransferase, partial [Clostridia bacterium]|nr:16S rRNA (uracil(1498)-N(3))-methyltransferase [Clostridia bacterium]
EGGFEEEEAALAKEHGMKLTGLGRRILRTETAAPFVLSCLSCRYEL